MEKNRILSYRTCTYLTFGALGIWLFSFIIGAHDYNLIWFKNATLFSTILIFLGCLCIFQKKWAVWPYLLYLLYLSRILPSFVLMIKVNPTFGISYLVHMIMLVASLIILSILYRKNLKLSKSLSQIL